jgi:hypothetical protein
MCLWLVSCLSLDLPSVAVDLDALYRPMGWHLDFAVFHLLGLRHHYHSLDLLVELEIW